MKIHKRRPSYPIPVQAVLLGADLPSSRWLWREDTHLQAKRAVAGAPGKRTGSDKEKNERGADARLRTSCQGCHHSHFDAITSKSPVKPTLKTHCSELESNLCNTPALSAYWLLTLWLQGPFSFNHSHFYMVWRLSKLLEKMIKCLKVAGPD